MTTAFTEHRTLVGLWMLQGGHCAYCGRMMPHPDHASKSKPTDRPTIDHMTPLSRGGRDDVDNRVAACDGCNQAKGSLDAPTFIAVRFNATMLKEARRRADCVGRVNPVPTDAGR